MNELIDTTAHIFLSDGEILFDKNFEVIRSDSVDITQLCAAMNSTLFQLAVHSSGRENFGGGAIRVATHELANLQVVRSFEYKGILDRLGEAEKALGVGLAEAAFVLAWSALEAAARELIAAQGVSNQQITTTSFVLDQAVSLGVIPRGCRQNSLVQSTSALIWQMARKEADLLA